MPVIINTGGLAESNAVTPQDTGWVNLNTFDSAPFGTVTLVGINASSLKFNDGLYAGTVVAGDFSTTYIRGVDLDMPSLPPGAVITGIQVRHLPAYFCCGVGYEISIRLFQSGSIIGDERTILQAIPPSFSTYFTRGGVADLWGAGPLTGTDINDATFGFGVAYFCNSPGGFFNFSFINLNHMQMRIFYIA